MFLSTLWNRSVTRVARGAQLVALVVLALASCDAPQDGPSAAAPGPGPRSTPSSVPSPSPLPTPPPLPVTISISPASDTLGREACAPSLRATTAPTGPSR